MHKVKELREKQGLSLKDVEARSGVDGSLINRIENGKVTPRIDTIVKLARAFGVPVGELLVEYEQEFVAT